MFGKLFVFSEFKTTKQTLISPLVFILPNEAFNERCKISKVAEWLAIREKIVISDPNPYFMIRHYRLLCPDGNSNTGRDWKRYIIANVDIYRLIQYL